MVKHLVAAQTELLALGGLLAITAQDAELVGDAVLQLRRRAASLALQLPAANGSVVDAGAVYNAEHCVSSADELLRAIRADLGLANPEPGIDMTARPRPGG